MLLADVTPIAPAVAATWGTSIEVCVKPQLFGKMPDFGPTMWTVRQWTNDNIKGAVEVMISRRHMWSPDKAYIRITCLNSEEAMKAHEFFN